MAKRIRKKSIKFVDMSEKMTSQSGLVRLEVKNDRMPRDMLTAFLVRDKLAQNKGTKAFSKYYG